MSVTLVSEVILFTFASAAIVCSRMSVHSASDSEGGSERSSSPATPSPEQVWYRFEDRNWEFTLSGRLRAIRPEGPAHLPVTVYLHRRGPPDSEGFDLIPATVFPGDTIFDLEWRLGVHRSGISSGRLTCPCSREDLIARGFDPDSYDGGDRVFVQGRLRVEDCPGYFFDNQVFYLSFL